MANEYSEDYKRIRKEAETKWPKWKVEFYNNCFAIGKNAKKIKFKECKNE